MTALKKRCVFLDEERAEAIADRFKGLSLGRQEELLMLVTVFGGSQHFGLLPSQYSEITDVIWDEAD